ncbi:hypothetical protein MML48_1g08619 [Holotrichia oblita]|nr:hypothetical protein MML48_1g03954 [Holotrichia oblita]KAI4472075.1 hypothetical protein MML48_1g08619 [Holotrichia oblita]
MAGDDSPTEKREEFNFGRSTPPPTTSHVAGNRQEHSIDIKTAAEPPKEEKEKDKDKDKDEKDEIDVHRPDANPGYNPDEIRKREEDEPKRRDKRDDNDRDNRDKPEKKIDGSDMLDGQWIPPKDAAKKHANEEEEDDNCAVKCLYYTMQCCECSIS